MGKGAGKGGVDGAMAALPASAMHAMMSGITGNSERSCRDVFFLLFFGVFWIGMFIIAGMAGSKGDINRLLYDLDGYGDLCNSEGRGSKVHWLDPKEFMVMGPIGEAHHRVCVDKCPTLSVLTENPNPASFTADELNEYFVCYYKYEYCTSTGNCDASLLTEENKFDTHYASTVFAEETSSFTSWCHPVLLPTKEVLNRCWPDMFNPEAAEAIVDTVKTIAPEWTYGPMQQVADGFADAYKAYAVWVTCGLAIPLVMSFIWCGIMRYLSGLMTWLTVLAVNLAFWGVTVWLMVKGGIIGDDYVDAIGMEIPYGMADMDVENKDTICVLAWIALTLTILLLIFTMFMISRIKIAIATIKVASQAIGAMPMIVFWPFVPFVMTVCLVVYWVMIAALIYTAGTVTMDDPRCLDEAYRASVAPSDDCFGYMVEFNDQIRYGALYHFFGLLWTYQFIVGVSLVTIAGAISNFYWHRGDSSQMPMMPVVSSFKRCCRFHLGSVALGSFIVALVQFARAGLEYLDRKTKAAQEGNPILKYLMCMAKYCLWYLECIIKFINRNAYIMIAVKGNNYCASASNAMGLIVRNALRLVAINLVGDIIPLLGKLAIAASCGVLAFVACDDPHFQSGATEISSPLFPVVLSVIFAYFVADCFFSVFEMAVDTIILSFCEDCDSNGGNAKFAPPLLMEAIGKDVKGNDL